jgi:hypothetical protein
LGYDIPLRKMAMAGNRGLVNKTESKPTLLKDTE